MVHQVSLRLTRAYQIFEIRTLSLQITYDLYFALVINKLDVCKDKSLTPVTPLLKFNRGGADKKWNGPIAHVPNFTGIALHL